MSLHEQNCEPCQGGIPPLTAEDQAPLLEQLQDWAAVDGHHLEKEWCFSDFASALAWVNRAGAICEAQGHHADFELGWGRAGVRIWTHKVDGLTQADFVLASKFDHLRAGG